MPFPQSLQKKPPSARQNFYVLFVSMLIGLICGPVFVFAGIHTDRRDRPSLQWPKITGKMLQWNKTWHSGGRHSSGGYSFAATYTYIVNDRRYAGNQIAMWEVDLDRGGDFGDFAAAHPAASQVDVYYDPQNPGNAVLIPGPNVTIVRLLTIGGSFLFAVSLFAAFLLPSRFARMQQEKLSQTREILVS